MCWPRSTLSSAAPHLENMGNNSIPRAYFQGNHIHWSFPGISGSKQSACNARDLGSIPGSGRSPEEGNSYSLQYSCLENPMDTSLAGYSPLGHKGWDTTEATNTTYWLASQVALVVKNPPANAAGDVRDSGSVPRLGWASWERNGNPLQYSCLENPMDRGAWQATVHGVT